MRRAVIAITDGGVKLALAISEKAPSVIFTLDKYADENRLLAMNTGLKSFMENAFRDFNEIVMIMSCGIAVRSIAPWLDTKLKDPAVVVVDELGKHAISLISGHIGGANSLAREIAELIGGTAVITTASDVLGIEAVDTMAQRLGLEIEDFQLAKQVTACMVNGRPTGIICDDDNYSLDKNLIHVKDCRRLNEYKLDALVYIGNKDLHEISKLNIPKVRLIKKNLIVGIGCRRNTDPHKLLDNFQSLCQQHGILTNAVKKLATIAIKSREEAILKLSENLNVPVSIIDIEKIREVEHMFEGSELVREVTGVGCVSQPCAYIESGYGRCIIPKTKLDGITMSVYEEISEVINER